LTLTLELQDESSEGSTAEVAASATGPGSAGQSLVGPLRTPDEPEVLEELAVDPGANALPALSWARYVMGLDQAIESLRDQADARLLQEEQPATAEKPGATRLDDVQAGRPTEKTSCLDQAVWGTGRWLDAEDQRLSAIDQTIGSWNQNEPGSSQSLFPSLADRSLRKSHAPSARFVEVVDREKLFPGLGTDHPQPVEIQVSRAVTMVAISAIAVKARQGRLRRSSIH
jgi:hypothetical protein